MRVIKYGDVNRLMKVIRFECPKCGCVFEANNKEYKYDFNQRDECSWYQIKCPTCNNWVTKNAD